MRRPEPILDSDAAALVAALFKGIFERPLWATFLDALRRRTGADHVVLIFHPPGRRLDEAMHLISGTVPTSVIEQHFREYAAMVNLPPSVLPEAEPFSLDDLTARFDASSLNFYRGIFQEYGITGIRQMRVQEATGVDAWLTLARRGGDFTPDDDALLRSLAPVLRGVLQTYVAMERERFAASLTADAVRRLQFGWLTLDRAGQVLDADEQGALVLAGSGVLRRNASGRLAAENPAVEREIFHALARVADRPHSRPGAITLSRDPWLDMLIVPVRGKPISAAQAPAAIAYVHADSWRSEDRCARLAEVFALTPSEARLALALSRGMTIAEAAPEFGLTIESARIYSKRIYAKTGARGLPDLVRIVMRSVLLIAPDA